MLPLLERREYGFGVITVENPNGKEHRTSDGNLGLYGFIGALNPKP